MELKYRDLPRYLKRKLPLGLPPEYYTFEKVEEHPGARVFEYFVRNKRTKKLRWSCWKMRGVWYISEV